MVTEPGIFEVLGLQGIYIYIYVWTSNEQGQVLCTHYTPSLSPENVRSTFLRGNPMSKFQHSRCKGTTNQIKAAQIRTPNSRSQTSRTCLGKPGAAQCDPPSLADIDVTYTGARWPGTTHIALSPPSISRRVWQNSHLCV